MYWKMLLREVLNKKDPSYPFLFTNLGELTVCEPDPEELAKRKLRNQHRAKKYFLGKKYPGVYFTRREAECMLYVLRDKTAPETAQVLNLSTRTVEFYVQKMREKLNCQTKLELLGKVRSSEFLDQVDFE